ncbi:TolC family protein [Massilia sp. H-1]|nr:TolC family protein [Massilia sp. H-1]
MWGRVKRVVEAADAQALATQNDRDGVILLLSAQVAHTYWQLRGAGRRTGDPDPGAQSAPEAQDVVEARLNGGLTNELDVARARIERANAEADLHEVQRQRNLLEHSLAVLTGVSPSSALIAARDTAVLPEPCGHSGRPAKPACWRSVPTWPPAWPGLRAANAQVAVAEGAFYPSLSLTGNFGYASESLSNLASGGARQFSIGPLALSLPIFDGGRNKSNLAMAKARYGEAIANHEGKLLTALREVEDALSDVQQRQKQGQVQAQSQEAAARGYWLPARYERGLSIYLDVTDAQRSSLAADRAAAQIRTQRLLAAVAVARSLGAGWTPQAPVATIANAK